MKAKIKILITEDEADVASFISRSLEELGYETFVAYDGETGMRLAQNHKPELIIADIIMPVKSGLQFCRELRTAGNEVPLILLTALGSTQDIVAGLDAGADDYLPKPFQLPELLARVRALLRRKECMDDVNFIQIDDLLIDFKKKEVTRAEKNIELTAKEFRLLEFLARNRGKVKSRADILQEVWGLGFDPGTNIVDVYINYLRNKIDKPFNRKLFYTKAGQGYSLQDQ